MKLEQKYINRFASRVDTSSGVSACWPWLGPIANNGYGKYRANTKNFKAHRLSWIIYKGPIPDGLCVCHRCDNPPCCNPAHLFLGTHKDNAEDRNRKGRQASGDRNGSRTHPERLKRGANHPHRIHPEKCRRGEAVNTAILTPNLIRLARKMKANGFTCAAVGAAIGCTTSNVKRIVRRETWRHIK